MNIYQRLFRIEKAVALLIRAPGFGAALSESAVIDAFLKMRMDTIEKAMYEEEQERQGSTVIETGK